MAGLSRHGTLLAGLLLLACSDAATRSIDEGNRLARSGKLDAAAERFEEAARLDPGPRARVLLGNVRWAQGKAEQAREAWAEALKVAPEQPDALLGTARADLAAGQTAKAAETAGAVIERHPERADARLVRAAARLAGQQQLDEALTDVDAALTGRGEELEALYLKGCVLIALKRYADAQAAFSALSERAPRSALSAYGEARLAAAQSRRADVKVYLLEAKSALGDHFEPDRVALDPAFDFVRDDPDLALPAADGGP